MCSTEYVNIGLTPVQFGRTVCCIPEQAFYLAVLAIAQCDFSVCTISLLVIIERKT